MAPDSLNSEFCMSQEVKCHMISFHVINIQEIYFRPRYICPKKSCHVINIQNIYPRYNCQKRKYTRGIFAKKYVMSSIFRSEPFISARSIFAQLSAVRRRLTRKNFYQKDFVSNLDNCLSNLWKFDNEEQKFWEIGQDLLTFMQIWLILTSDSTGGN